MGEHFLHQIAVVEPVREPAPAVELVEQDLVGPICESGDYLTETRRLPPFAPGDLMAFMSAGAYGAVMASRYNLREPAEELAPTLAEEVRDRDRVAEGDERGMDAVLQGRALTHEMQPEPGPLALATDVGVGQPDGRHQVATGQLREDAGVDPIGLGRQGREALDLHGVGDLDPSMYDWRGAVARVTITRID